MRLAGVIAVLVLVAGAWFFGYQNGGADCRADYQARELEAMQRASELDNERRAAEKSREALVRKLEEQAHAEPVAVPQCLGPKRVLRLNSLR